ncbi:GDP-mannose 4,6-dehydratase [Candidatus Micrarchaeota archaeon]|nr:GDP-mannose 4,6-dehydratase [Candidatus Micrarchaeota archaeon]
MKSALITGITGQDGAYLAKFLLDKGYKVFGTYRRLSTPNFWRLFAVDVYDKVTLIPAELIDSASLTEALKVSEPDEVYHLAAQSFVGASFEQPVGTGQVTGIGVARLLEAIRSFDPKIKTYQASTSELYGNNKKEAQNEETTFSPASPYSAAKLYGYWMTRIYREGYKMFCSNGILFNHESPIRGLEFVTRKITNAVSRISLGLQKKLVLGNLDAKRDWGYAPDYVEGMHMILQHHEPEDFVFATGEAHSVRDFVEKAFAVVDLDWHKYVETDQRCKRPLDVNHLCGDYSKAKEHLGWKPKVKFDELVKIMTKADVERWTRWQKGEVFPWDAPNHLDELHILSRALKA